MFQVLSIAEICIFFTEMWFLITEICISIIEICIVRFRGLSLYGNPFYFILLLPHVYSLAFL